MKSSANFDPSTTAILETDDEITFSADTTAQVSVDSYKANEITLETSSSEDGFLVLSEIYYPDGWEATIDGEPTDIYITNFVLRGLQIPAGEHTVRLTFEPTSEIWGSRLAWFGHIMLWIAGLGVVGFQFGWIGKQDNPESSEEIKS